MEKEIAISNNIPEDSDEFNKFLNLRIGMMTEIPTHHYLKDDMTYNVNEDLL